MTDPSRRVIVIGAGLAGLACANALMAAGKETLVFEAEDTVGGRIRTTTTSDGFRLDRGFQVLFSAYPALRRQVPIAALQPKYFAAGVEVMIDGRAVVLGHPLLDPGTLVSSVRSGMVSPSDVLTLVRTVWSSSGFGDRALPSSYIPTRTALRDAGASDRFVQCLAAPLFGGISLDRSLSSDSTFWGFVLRNMALGRVFLPAYGIGQLTQLMASRLPRAAIRFSTRVSEVLVEGNRVAGVRVGNETVLADAVVVATEAPQAARLTGLNLPAGHRSCTTAYFATDVPVTGSRRLILNAQESPVNHVAQLTNIAPAYAPYGRHLLSVTSLSALDGDDDTVAAVMATDVKDWLPGANRCTLHPLAVIRVSYAQFEQGPGIYSRLPGAGTTVDGLHLGGEYLHSSSVQGAIRGGELAASSVLQSMV